MLLIINDPYETENSAHSPVSTFTTFYLTTSAHLRSKVIYILRIALIIL